MWDFVSVDKAQLEFPPETKLHTQKCNTSGYLARYREKNRRFGYLTMVQYARAGKQVCDNCRQHFLAFWRHLWQEQVCQGSADRTVVELASERTPLGRK